MKKRILVICLVLTMVLSMVPASALAVETADLTISDVESLQAFAAAVNGTGETFENKKVVLAADLDLTNLAWTPIGNGTRSGATYTGNAFMGTFDGQDHTITGLTNSLFGVVDGGTVQNLKLADVAINNSAADSTGAAVAVLQAGTVSNVHITSGFVTGLKATGGIVGRVLAVGTVIGCSNAAAINSTSTGDAAGGIIGKAYYTSNDGVMTVSDCINTGTVTSPYCAGGIVGYSAANVSGCTNSGEVTGTNDAAGGMTGEQCRYGTVAGNTNSGNISGNAAGGIVGWVRYNNGDKDYPRTEMITVAGNTNNGKIIIGGTGGSAGGIVGLVYNQAVVSGNMNTATSISAGVFAAGICTVQSVPDNLYIGESHDFTITGNNTTTALENIAANCTNVIAYDNTMSLDLSSNTTGVAKVDDTYYGTLADAIAQAGENAEIDLIVSVTLDDKLTIPADKVIILDLNGMTVSQTKQQTGAYSMITNNGNPTITDSGEGGTISYIDSGNGGEYVSNTIQNNGTLVVTGGTITNQSGETVASNGYPHAIDTKGTLTINGGTVTCERYSAIRIWCSSESEASVVNIHSGTINGAVDFQNVNDNTNQGQLTIDGGTFNQTGNANVIRFLNFGTNYAQMKATISGGIFNGGIGKTSAPNAKDFVYGDVFHVIGGQFAEVPVCVAAGYTGNVKVGNYYIVHEHNSDKLQTVTPASCTKTGEGKLLCSVCDTVMVEKHELPKIAHTEVVVEGKEATCTETGLTEGKKCSVCGTVTAEQEVIEKLVHTEVVLEGKKATCTETGLTEGKKCSVCGTVTAEQKVIEKLAHTEVVLAGKKATCTETGLTEGKKCSACGTTTVEQETIAKIAHTEVVVAGKAATCTEPGLTEGKKCSVCATVTVEQKVIEKTAHTEVVLEGKKATCTEDGLTEGKKCSVCGVVTVAQETIAKLGHELEEVKEKAATYFAAGNIAHHRCAACGTLFADAEGKKTLEASEVVIAQLVKVEEEKAEVNTAVVENAVKEAETAGTVDVVITVTKDEMSEEPENEEEQAPAVVVTKTELPVAAVEQVADLHEEATLTIQMTNATVTMDKTTMEVVAQQAKEESADSIAMEIKHIETEALAPEQQKAVEEKKIAAVISASILVNDKEIHDFQGGEVKVAIPFALEAGTKAEDYKVLYIADDGSTEEIPASYENGTLVMTLSHFSEYVVVNTSVTAPKDPSNPGTGDAFLPGLTVAVMIAAAAVAVFLEKKRNAR